VPKSKHIHLSFFKGREARLNRAVFQSLALKVAQTIYDIHRHVRTFRGLKYTYYGNVNKRVRALLQLGYVKEANIKSRRGNRALDVRKKALEDLKKATREEQQIEISRDNAYPS
jgi:hypothetical protein